jgi:hypothetical protein
MNTSQSPPQDSGAKYAAFGFGAITGSVAYALFLHLAQDDYARTVFGWLLFPIQFPIFLIFGDVSLNELGVIAVTFVPVAVMYGYVFWCFQRSPGVALLLFTLFSIGCWLWIQGILPYKPIELMFWPAGFIGENLQQWDFLPRQIRILIACLMVGFSYTAYLSGIYHVFVLFKKQPDPALNQIAQEQRARNRDNVSIDGQATPLSAINPMQINQQGIQNLSPSICEDKICPGWFVGKCTNKTVGLSANLLLTITGVNETTIHGELGLSGDLGGGGVFHGKIKGKSFEFTTCVPEMQTIIEWKGTLAADQISGEYIVKSDDPKIVAEGMQSQQGAWWCAFVRRLGSADPNKADQVYIFHDGLNIGPLEFAHFKQTIHSGRWPANAIVSLDDCTRWTTIGDYLAMNTGSQN